MLVINRKQMIPNVFIAGSENEVLKIKSVEDNTVFGVARIRKYVSYGEYEYTYEFSCVENSNHPNHNTWFQISEATFDMWLEDGTIQAWG